MILGSIIIILLMFVSPSYCEDVQLNMPIDDAKKIVVELEKSKIYKEQVEIIEEMNGKLVEQTVILNDQIIILKSTVELKQKQLELTTEQMDKQKEVYEDKLEVCEKDKPTFFDKFLIGTGGAGVGALIILLLVLL
jgi:hypothetical protein